MVVSSALIIYDDACYLCRQLAAMVVARQPAAFSAQGYSVWCADQMSAGAKAAPTAPALMVQREDTLLVDDEAWQYLLGHYRDLAAISWLATKIGIHRQTATALKRAGGALRLFCRRCKKRIAPSN